MSCSSLGTSKSKGNVGDRKETKRNGWSWNGTEQSQKNQGGGRGKKRRKERKKRKEAETHLRSEEAKKIDILYRKQRSTALECPEDGDLTKKTSTKKTEI